MLNEISIHVANVPTVDFPEYDKLLEDVTRLADEMKRTVVTEDSIKHYKKLLAQTRREFKQVDDERKRVKREIMAPYEELNNQVKTLQNILKEGERVLDSQIKAFRDREREEKWEEIEVQFKMFRSGYQAPTWLSFDMFKREYPSLANVSTSNGTINDSLRMFFERFDNDYEQLKQWYPVRTERTSILAVYANNGLDLMDAVKQYESVRAEGMRLQELEVEDKIEIVVDGQQKTYEDEYAVIKVKVSDLDEMVVPYELV